MQVPGEQHPARAPDGTHMLPHNVRVNTLPVNMLLVEMREEVAHLLMSPLNAEAEKKARNFFKKSWVLEIKKKLTIAQTKEASLDERLTVFHSGYGSRVPFRNVRIEG